MTEKMKELSFEEAMVKLEQSAESLKKGDITLENALKNFEEGIGYYQHCIQILNNAKQRISVYRKEKEAQS